jgi:hypothetical protein
MNQIETRKIHCPYCGESIDILVDCSIEHQSYIEDCQVCCRPIELDVTVDLDGGPLVVVKHENE